MNNRASGLSGVKVIEVGNFISAPYCGKLLADCGAEVIKIEPPGAGDQARAYGPFPRDIPHAEKSGLFLYLNTNKLSLTLDISCEIGQTILKRLLEQSDVLVTNLLPAQTRKLGLTVKKLGRIAPQLIIACITPFGLTGPYRDYKGYHNTSAALGGVFILGYPDREPITYPLLQGHFQGGIHAATAIMMALMARRKTGKGQLVDISESDVWASYFSAMGTQSYIFANRIRKREGHRQKGMYYPLCLLPCKDGFIVEVAVTGAQWKRFLEIMGGGKVPDWYANDPRFKDRVEMSIKYPDELDAMQAPWLMAHTKEEIFTLCREKHIPFAPVYNSEEIVNHPHLKARKYFVEIDHPVAGQFTYPGAQVDLSETPMQINRAPLLGEHNVEILCGRLGFPKDDLVRLAQAGVI